MKAALPIIFGVAATILAATKAQAVFYHGRAYEPNLQRWIQRDPIGERGGINLYQFVHNDPVNKVDPWGLDVYTTTVTGFFNIPHRQVLGDDGSGGAYESDFGPTESASFWDRTLFGAPGKYGHHPSPRVPACDLYSNNPKKLRLKTTKAVDEALAKIAENLSGPGPEYKLLGNNCYSFGNCFLGIAANLQSFGTPYAPNTTFQNLPPLTITLPRP